MNSWSSDEPTFVNPQSGRALAGVPVSRPWTATVRRVVREEGATQNLQCQVRIRVPHALEDPTELGRTVEDDVRHEVVVEPRLRHSANCSPVQGIRTALRNQCGIAGPVRAVRLAG